MPMISTVQISQCNRCDRLQQKGREGREYRKCCLTFKRTKQNQDYIKTFQAKTKKYKH